MSCNCSRCISHDFQPRYDTGIPALPGQFWVEVKNWNADRVQETLFDHATKTNKRYIGDVCINCGKFVSRDPRPPRE